MLQWEPGVTRRGVLGKQKNEFLQCNQRHVKCKGFAVRVSVNLALLIDGAALLQCYAPFGQ